MQLANLSQPACEIVFLHWVVTERNLSPYLSPIERLTCPVLWCGINFDNDESLLCHLKDCPHLSTSGYWCPRCHRAESFASHKIPVPRPSYPIPVQKRPSRLRKLLHKHFIRKRASEPSQDSTMIPELDTQELYRYHGYPIEEMDGQGIQEHYDLSGLSSGWGAPIGTWGQQSNTWGSPDTPITNSPPFEMDSWIHGVEKDGDMILELATDGDQITGNTSFPESSQLNEPLNQSGPVPYLFAPDVDDLFQQVEEALLPSNFDHIGQATFTEPARQSQIDGRNTAPGMFDRQNIPSEYRRELRPTYPGYDPSHIPDWDPETGPVNAPLAASYNQTNTTCSNESMGTALTPVTAFSDAGSSARLPTHSSYSPSRTRNWAEGHPQVSPNHAPRSTPSPYGLLHTPSLAHINIKPTINTINVPAGGQRVRHGHSNPETGPGNSPLSASSNQTDTTYSNESMGTVITPVTPFSDLASPTGSSPRNVSNSTQSSGNPRQNRFTCKTCGRTLTDASNLRRHEKHKHSEVDPIPCRAGCGREFTRRDNEGRHYENESKMERPGSDTKRRKSRRCGVLHFAFASNNNLGSRGTGSSALRAENEPSGSLC